MISDIKMKVDQLAPDVLSEGNMENPRMSKVGQVFTADWKMRLILAGRAYRLSFGTLTGTTAHVLVGVGTTVDLDMPLAVIAADTGYLIPMSLQACFIADISADNDISNIILTADRAVAVTAACIATGSATAETPDNLLDGGDAFTGRAASDFTVALGATPTHSDILYFNNWEGLGTDPLGPSNLFCDHEFEYPTFLAGPCSLMLYAGGVDAMTGMGSLVFAHIPSSWVPVS